MNKNKIEIVLVTGFLGAGKTTLLNKLIAFYNNKRIGLIINDFGKIAVDVILLHDFASGSDDRNNSIYEISNGSIFCSCLSEDLVKSLKHFAKIKPDVLLIETSGLSDPSTFSKILTENRLGIIYNITTSFCVFDAIKSLKLADKITAIDKQIRSSNIILINKIDLITNKEYVKIEKYLFERNETAKIIKTTFTDVDLSILDTQYQTIYKQEAETCNTVNSRSGSIVLKGEGITNDSLIEFYEKIKNNIFRIKGFLNIKGITYYISDNNYKLQIQKSDKNVECYGLSVLLPTDTVDFVEKNWEKLLTIDY